MPAVYCTTHGDDACGHRPHLHRLANPQGKSIAPRARNGVRDRYLGAVLGMAMSSRQVLLHIAPGDPGYGTAVMGMHLYTWALVSFVVVLGFCGVMLTLGRWVVPIAPQMAPLRWISWIVIALFLLTILLNAVVVFAESGWHWFLPDDPNSYRLFNE